MIDLCEKTAVIKVNVNGVFKEVKRGISLLELSKMVEQGTKLDVLAARVNNKVQDLQEVLEEDCTVRFIDMTCEDGVRIYKRSLFFVLLKAVKTMYPERKLNIRHSLSRGTYCEMHGIRPLEKEELENLEEKMQEIVSKKIPLIRRKVSAQEARELFKQAGELDKVSLLEHWNKEDFSIYSLGDMDNYLYGYMVPHTGYLKKFELKYYKKGFILRYPDKYSPFEIPAYEENPKLFQVLDEYKKWGEILNISNVGALNELISAGKGGEIIRISEALHEKKIAYIADTIQEKADQLKVILISGPSSSGKTTFAQRLAVHLRVNALKPVTISLDDYFVERKFTPVDENGEPDFEAVEAIDIDLFNQHLRQLIEGKEVEIPIFSFHTGKREPKGRPLQLINGEIMIIEGIHGLNERLTFAIPHKHKFKIYVSALMQLSRDNYNPNSTTDTRLIRRMVRDNQFRSNPPIGTFNMWPSVRRGETRNIFPFQEQADVMFNSALVYELAVLKDHAIPLLEQIKSNEEAYSEARRLISFLRFFKSLPSDQIPNNSIIREFIGGSVFY